MSNPVTIIMIEDDEGHARLIERNIRRSGVNNEIIPFTNGTEALNYLFGKDGTGLDHKGNALLILLDLNLPDTGGIDAIALDQYMPGLDGLETLEQILAIPGAPPVVFVTASQDSAIAVTALKAGAADYLVKDVQGDFIPLLQVAVTGALRQAEIQRARDEAEAEVHASRDRYAALAAEREVLLREVNHRVGNSLQIIAS